MTLNTVLVFAAVGVFAWLIVAAIALRNRAQSLVAWGVLLALTFVAYVCRHIEYAAISDGLMLGFVIMHVVAAALVYPMSFLPHKSGD